MRKFLLLLSLLAAGVAHAQKIADPKPLANAITAEDLKKHLYIVASKEFEGRETATEGQRKAAAYIENHFKSLGLLPGNKDSYQLYYPVFQDSMTSAMLKIKDQPFRLDEDFSVNTGANSTATLMGSEIVFAGYGISDSSRDDYKDLDAKGKIVLVMNGEPTGYKPPASTARRRGFGGNAKLEAAQKNGAAGVLIIQSGCPRGSFGARGNMYLNAYKKTIFPNTFFVSEKVAEAIMGADYAAAKAGNPQSKAYTADIMMQFSKAVTNLQSSDVLGFLEGTDLKDQVLVISAHYDHLGKRDTVIFYGADDDGSGTVSVLEIAQA